MLVIFNPIAGSRRARPLWRVLDVLIANGVRLDVAETRCPGHAESLAREAAAAGETLIVAAGGDGTIAEVANGLMGSDARLGIIPLGTANVLAGELGLSLTPGGIAAALAFGRTRVHWPGLARGSRGSWMFVQMLGVGFDARVVHRINAPLKRMLGRNAYVVQTLAELLRYDFHPITVRIDDQETQAASVIVSKGRFYGGKFHVTDDARPAEPGFSVLLFDRSGPAAALMYGAALPLGRLGRAPGVRHLRARHIVFGTNQMIPAQSDGDSAGHTPLSITDAPGPIHVVVG
jgi:diacylglycerol kinase (ATP)